MYDGYYVIERAKRVKKITKLVLILLNHGFLSRCSVFVAMCSELHCYSYVNAVATLITKIINRMHVIERRAATFFAIVVIVNSS